MAMQCDFQIKLRLSQKCPIEPLEAENYHRKLVDFASTPIMDTLLATALTPTLYGWLCFAIIACAVVMPKGLIAMDRMLARRPERSEWSGWSQVPEAFDAIRPSIWPRVMTAIGSVLLFAALLTLMFLCRQLAL
jgi:hypothetical protein